MADAWESLLALGVPAGAARAVPSVPFDARRARAAVLEITRADDLDPARVAPLLAWLRAWRHHWRNHFEATLGPASDAILARLEADLDDPNRYLKLRRIATANLAGLL